MYIINLIISLNIGKRPKINYIYSKRFVIVGNILHRNKIDLEYLNTIVVQLLENNVNFT